MDEWRAALLRDRLIAYREDLADWIAKVTGTHVERETLISDLENGVILAQLAQAIVAGEAQYHGREPPPPPYKVAEGDRLGPFQARDNVANFIEWVRRKVPQAVLFETIDLVEGKNEKQVLYCLMELGRQQHGVPPPKLIAMEAQIDGVLKAERGGQQLPAPLDSEDGLQEMIEHEAQLCGFDIEACQERDVAGRYFFGREEPVFVRRLGEHVLVRLGNEWVGLKHYLRLIGNEVPMPGGSAGASPSSRLSMSARLDQLQRELEQAKEREGASSSRLKAEQQLRSERELEHQAEIERLNEELRHMSQSRWQNEGEIERLERQLADAESGRKSSEHASETRDLEMQALTEELARLRQENEANREQASGVVSQLEREHNALRQQMVERDRALQAEIRRRQEAEDATARNLEQLRAEKAKLERHASDLEESLGRASREVSDSEAVFQRELADLRAQLSAERADARQQRQQLEDELSGLREQLQHERVLRSTKLKEADDSLRDERERRQRIERDMDEVVASHRVTQQQLSELEDEFADFSRTSQDASVLETSAVALNEVQAANETLREQVSRLQDELNATKRLGASALRPDARMLDELDQLRALLAESERKRKDCEEKLHDCDCHGEARAGGSDPGPSSLVIRGPYGPVELISTSNWSEVDRAVREMEPHSVIGVSAQWCTKAPGASYPISTLQMTTADKTYVFLIDTRLLPMAIRLLLRQQDNAKVAYRAVELASHIWRDHGFMVYPLYELEPVIVNDLGTNDMDKAVRKAMPSVVVPTRHMFAKTNWKHRPLSRQEAEFAAYNSWAPHALWMRLNNSGAQPLDMAELAERLSCPYCSERFENERARQDHIDEHHNFNCELCGAHFTSVDDLEQHRLEEHVQCPVCGEWVANREELEAHERLDHNKHCRLRKLGCPGIFVSIKEMERHMERAHARCPVCKKWFLDNEALQEHLNEHHTCPFCGRFFPDKTQLRQHIYARVNGICYGFSAAATPEMFNSLAHAPPDDLTRVSSPLQKTLRSPPGGTPRRASAPVISPARSTPRQRSRQSFMRTAPRYY
eukprot:m.86366 g.86366  ORF g.86366 m.86366 type:complete len:1054 (+) comp8429_c0_seq1:217-3378(+)